jgi:hypothetical protein
MVEPPPNILSLPQNPRLASVDEEGRSLRGLNLGVGAGESIRFLLGVGAGTGTAERAGESVKAEIRGAGSESANAVSGWRIFIVDALSVSNSLLHNQHDPDSSGEKPTAGPRSQSCG